MALAARGPVRLSAAVEWPMPWKVQIMSPASGDPTRRLGAFLVADSGSTVAELALLMPVISMLLFGTIYFGIALTNYQQLTFGVLSGARYFATARGAGTPWSAAATAVYNAAPNLTAGSITLAYTVNGVTCGSDTACSTALSTAAGLPSKLTGTYPCSLVVPFSISVSTCTLTAASSQVVQ